MNDNYKYDQQMFLGGLGGAVKRWEDDQPLEGAQKSMAEAAYRAGLSGAEGAAGLGTQPQAAGGIEVDDLLAGLYGPEQATPGLQAAPVSPERGLVNEAVGSVKEAVGKLTSPKPVTRPAPQVTRASQPQKAAVQPAVEKPQAQAPALKNKDYQPVMDFYRMTAPGFEKTLKMMMMK